MQDFEIEMKMERLKKDSHPEPYDETTADEYRRLFNERVEYWLDQGYGKCLLNLAENKDIVEQALRHFDGQRYHLGEFIVMPNHVHVLITPVAEYQLSEILHSWKSFTSNAINKREGLSGAFWQKEYFDHIVRTPEQMERVILYIKQNPIPHGEQDLQTLYETTFGNDPIKGRSAFQALSAEQAAGTDSGASAADCDVDSKAAGSRFYPAAGGFEAWPEHLGELKVMDPCCGSGHFLVAAFQMLVPMRMELEDLSVQEAVDAVLRDNLHGLELDQRCVEIAAFALALAAWRYPDSIGYRPLPTLNLACSGLGIHTAKADWLDLADGDTDLEHALESLYDLFKDAPTLGSLIDPRRLFSGDLLDLTWDRVSPLVDQALSVEAASSRFSDCKRQDGASTEQRRELGVVAQGLARAAQLLAGEYHWVLTNVPYLSRGKQAPKLKDFCESRYPNAKNDLANVFLARCLELVRSNGVVQIVMPQNWLFLTSYRKQREHLLREVTWNLLVRLGEGGFESSQAAGAFTILLTQTRAAPGEQGMLRGVDASQPQTAAEKADLLRVGQIVAASQQRQLGNPDARVSLDLLEHDNLLSEYADAYWGQGTGDFSRFGRFYWELQCLFPDWEFGQTTVDDSLDFGGRIHAVYWQKGAGELVALAELLRHRLKNIHYRGSQAWGREGISVTLMRVLRVTRYSGQIFDGNCATIVPKELDDLAPIWCFCASSEFDQSVRKIDQKLNVTNATLLKIPFDRAHWQKIAAERYLNGLPKPYSDDPTQWIFHGHPCGSVVWDEEAKWTAIGVKRTDETVLQSSVARLLGYRWPAEVETLQVKAASSRLDAAAREAEAIALDGKRQDGASTSAPMELADEAHALIAEAQKLNAFSDDDGIVCLPAIRGESAAHERLLRLLEAAWGDDWTAGTLSKLLAEAGAKGKGLDVWLRDYFFQQHCKLFHNRPFIWHIWDGLKDGFAALVNYHKLDRANLERLIYTYLGDWIRLQERAAGEGAQGADERLAAARGLKTKLEAILEGEAPLDIFVRWKPIEEQPMGWEPDINDGVRLNIRPFLLAGDVGKKGAGVLRAKPNIHWKKDRGKDVESAPWFHLFKGDRINDHHLTLAEKRAAREQS